MMDRLVNLHQAASALSRWIPPFHQCHTARKKAGPVCQPESISNDSIPQNRLFPYRFLELAELAELAAIIAPPVPAFYARPQHLEEMIDHSVGRVLDMFDIELGVVRRWRKQAEHVLTLDEVKSCS
jgi:hypothetical protein